MTGSDTTFDSTNDDLALLEEFAEIEHSIPYGHFLDQTPVAVMLTILNDVFGPLGYVALVCLITILMMCFPRSFVVFVFMGIALFGGTWVISSVLSQNMVLRANYLGISLPLFFMLPMKGELDRPWSDLKEVTFLRYDMPSYDPEFIVLKFRGGASATFRIDGFTRADLERLFLVINTYAPHARIYPEISQLTDGMLSKGRMTRALGFTEIWQSELGMRFSTTAFVPHEAGDSLRDGEIKILGQIAFGGLSAIYLAKMKDERTVILKEAVLPESSCSQTVSKCLSLFEREAEMLSRIRHPRIASVFDYFVENDNHYLVLEYVDGKNLRTFVNEFGPQSEAKVSVWAEEIAEVLSYLHGLEPPVLHRDLTPDNMIVGKDGGITIIDFGAANTFLGTATGTVVGKNAYIPIEQFRGKATPRSDLYAFGGTIFFLLTGRDPEPFFENSPRQAGVEVSKSLDQLIKDCMKVEQDLRVPDALTLVCRLRSQGVDG